MLALAALAQLQMEGKDPVDVAICAAARGRPALDALKFD